MNTEPGKTARVLVVDDHPLLRHAVQRLLETLGLVCHEADSIHDALHVVRTSRPDLVIVDLSLGNESGLDLIRRLRTLDARLPVVVFSGHERAKFGELAFMAGARAYVMKRESRSALIDAVRDALNMPRMP